MNRRKLLCFVGLHRYERISDGFCHCPDCHSTWKRFWFMTRFRWVKGGKYDWVQRLPFCTVFHGHTAKQDADTKESIAKKIRGMR